MPGERIRRLREERGLTQLDLANILNISNVMLSRYENNKRYPDYKTLNRLADYFDVSTDYLLGRTRIRQSEKPSAADALAEYEALPPEVIKYVKKIAQYYKEETDKKKKWAAFLSPSYKTTLIICFQLCLCGAGGHCA